MPCFNERMRIDPRAFVDFADAARRIVFLFVNDGSTDGTAELLDQLASERRDQFGVLHLEKNRGKAEAVRSGVLHGIGLGYSYIGFWDADLATPLTATLEFAAHLDAHPETLMAIGARVRLLGRRIERARPTLPGPGIRDRGFLVPGYLGLRYTVSAQSYSAWCQTSSVSLSSRFGRGGSSTWRSSPASWGPTPTPI